METVLRYALVALIAYLLGSINFSIILSKLFAGTDIREHGSGNAGATNMFRLLGAKAGMLTVVFDVLKSLVAVFLGRYIIMGGEDALGAVLAGLFCITGHMYPMFFGFKGGKGVAAALGMALMINVWLGLGLFGVFCVIVFFTRYVSLGSIIGAALFGVLVPLLNLGQPNALLIGIAGAFTGALIIWAHRSNIGRLLSGAEKRIGRDKSRQGGEEDGGK